MSVKQMANASKELQCGPCEYRNRVIPAIVWCSDCAEGLCVGCCDHHDAAKVTRAHTCISVGSYLDLPMAVQELSMKCTFHGERLELYCPAHEAPCCVQCVTFVHNQCNGVTLLNKAIENIRSSVALETLQQTLENKIQSLDSATEGLLISINKLNEQKSDLLEQFRTLRHEIERGLNTSEQKLQSEIELIVFTETSKLRNTISTLNSHTSIYKAKQSDLHKIKAYGNNYQIYSAMKQMENELQKNDETFKAVLSTIDEVRIKFSKNSALVPILSDEFSFGSVEVQRSVQNLDIKTDQINAQILVGNKFPSLKIKLLFNPNEVFSENTMFRYAYITSVVALSTGEVVLVNSFSSGGIFLFDRCGQFSSKTTQFGTPDRACIVRDDLIAFSFPKNKNIKVLYPLYHEMVLFKTIQIYDSCSTLSSAEGNLVVSFRTLGSIQVIDLKGNVLKSFLIRTLANDLHCFQQKMIVTEYSSNKISCFDMDGRIIWEHWCKKGFVDIRHCCVDKYGNIFASEEKHGSIIFINPETGFEQDLLTLNELEEPNAITYDEKHNLLLVANRKGNCVVIYDIIY